MIAAEEIAMTLKIRAGCILLLLAAAAMALPAGAVTVDEATRALERGRRVYDLPGCLGRRPAPAAGAAGGDGTERGWRRGRW